MVQTCARWIVKVLLANLVVTPRWVNKSNMYVIFVGVHSFSRWFVCAQSFSRFSFSVLSVSLIKKSTHSDISLFLTSLCCLFFLSLCMWHSSQIQIVTTRLHVLNVLSPPREVEAGWIHIKDMLVVVIDETRTGDESMRTYVTDDGESVDWFAAISSVSSRPVNKSSSNITNKRLPCVGWPGSIDITQEPSDWVEARLFSGFMECPLGEESFWCTCHFYCPRAHVLYNW